MNKTWQTVLQVIAAIITSLLTTLGVSSCTMLL